VIFHSYVSLPEGIADDHFERGSPLNDLPIVAGRGQPPVTLCATPSQVTSEANSECCPQDVAMEPWPEIQRSSAG